LLKLCDLTACLIVDAPVLTGEAAPKDPTVRAVSPTPIPERM